jgi:hypothetical protein
MNDFSRPEGGDLTSGVDHLSVLRKQVFCKRTLPYGWRALPSTILNHDGWIVGQPRQRSGAAAQRAFNQMRLQR